MKSAMERVAASCFAAMMALFAVSVASAGVSPDEANQLKTTLTPLGAERAGSADGQIPAWTGGVTTQFPGRKTGDRLPDPFPNDKPVVTITSQNVGQYSERLSDGANAMFKKYPDFRIVVYPTRRTASAPQWVYDNTFLNATRGSVHGYSASNVYGGIPFPIPKSGVEAMFNHLLAWRGVTFEQRVVNWQGGPDGRRSFVGGVQIEQQFPYYFQGGSPSNFDGTYWLIKVTSFAPPIRAGEATVVRFNLDPDKQQAWTYLTGQRRSRRLPNACCDSPTVGTAGNMNYDENYLFQGTMDRYDWKLVGKREMYIPYNDNRAGDASIADLLGAHFLNPDLVRWELHRVWVVDATLRAGQRHTAPHARFYLDEDTWSAVLADRWDARGQLWKYQWALPVVDPDLPATAVTSFGENDLLAGSWFGTGLLNGQAHPTVLLPRMADSDFTGDAVASQSVR
jgi:hypothetical protein